MGIPNNTPCFVNLPLSWVSVNEAWLDWYIAAGLSPELGLDEHSLCRQDSWHAQVAQRLRDANLQCSVHLPFFDISPGSSDEGLLRKTRNVLTRSAKIASLYPAVHMIGHPDCPLAGDGYDTVGDIPTDAWYTTSVQTWASIPEMGEAQVYFENTYELSPHPLAKLVDMLPESHIGLCFDVGHWFAFAGGIKKKDMSAWVDAFAGRLRHVHLHDNNGGSDQHLGMGQGKVPFTELFYLLREHDLHLTATVEPHTVEAFAQTDAWFAKYPAWGEMFRWVSPRQTGLPIPTLL